MTTRAKWLLAALGVTGMAGAVYAQSSPPAANPGADGDHWHHDDGRDGRDGREGPDGGDHDGWHHEHWHRGHWHHHGHHHRRHHGGMDGMMVHLLHQLNLTDAQKQSVHKILADARAQEEARHKSAPRPNLAALANPGDPKHAAALQEFQTRMAERIKAQDQIHQQIYGVLTPEQKTQLAATLATRQARMAQRATG